MSLIKVPGREDPSLSSFSRCESPPVLARARFLPLGDSASSLEFGVSSVCVRFRVFCDPLAILRDFLTADDCWLSSSESETWTRRGIDDGGNDHRARVAFWDISVARDV